MSKEQRAELHGLVGSGSASARLLTRARILLKSDHGEGGPGWSDAAIVGAPDVNVSTVLRVRKQFVAMGLTPRWSLRLLAGELGRLEEVEAISHGTVWQALKKTK